jgi:nitrogen-specific signal transduction histidine kinase/ABC-type branched-subunit amino acid transport system ATPase component
MTSPERSEPLLLLDKLTAVVDGHVALNGVTLGVARGDVHAVVGSQGSGKSTLVKVIAGLIPRTGGKLFFDGRPVDKHSAGNALRLGILAVHQEAGLLPGLSSIENVFMNREIRKFLFFNDRRRMKEHLLEAFRAMHLDIDPERPIRYFDGPVQQLIELAKLACFPSRLVIVDEPSSRIRPEDVETLQYLLSVLRQNGATILYVTGSMEEVFNFASRVTVLDHGEVVETSEISNVDKNQLVQLTYASLFSRKKLEKSNLELFYLNNLNRNILNNIPLPVLVADSQGSIILVNKCLESVAQISQADLTGKPIAEFLRLAPEESEALARDVRDRRRHSISGWQLPARAAQAPVDLHVYPILDEDQSFMGTIYLVDIKDSPDVLAAHREALDSFQKNRRAIWEIAHEINNPLGIMLNYLTLIRSSSSVEEIQSSAAVIGRELKRVRRILSRVTGPVSEAHGKEAQASIRDAVAEVLSLLKLNLNEQITLGISLERDFIVPLEPDLLKQVFLNIVLNAVEAMPQGGSLSIREGCVARDGKGYATLTVHDTGGGIPPENLDRIFEPFFTTKSDSEARGLGLPLSKDIVSRVGGLIEVASAPTGTAITVYIPSKDVDCTSG